MSVTLYSVALTLTGVIANKVEITVAIDNILLILDKKRCNKSSKTFITSYIYIYSINPSTILASASSSVKPKVISLINCSPAIFPIAAS